ncbi:hypothetical protein FH603_3943 [Spirosoma sp. LMG 31447]|uniref:Uncharacterized protein n=1 Tax=Spirosoma utsteinense TaxID=2585773 RepID=A0ABR6WA29_9BACT|nr:hypothetical protein [Spirosoma utsteinense]
MQKFKGNGQKIGQYRKDGTVGLASFTLNQVKTIS